MEITRHKRNSRGGLISCLPSSLATFGIILALGGCQTFDTLLASHDSKPKFSFDTGPKLPPSSMPQYTIGESFTFSDKRTDTVIAVKGDIVTWRSDRGIINTQYRNFLIPPVSWQTKTRRSRANSTAQPTMLWPLKVGTQGQFDVSQVINQNDGSSKRELSQNWQCNVEGTENITVAAGNFDTFRVSCYRYAPNSNYWRQTRTFNYAPRIGHYVVREDTYINRPSKRRELVSTGFNSKALAKSVQANLIRVFRDTMNKNRDYAMRSWKSADGRISATLMPTSTFKKAGEATCRDYTSTYDFGGKVKTNNKRACKQNDGKWKVVSRDLKFPKIKTPADGKTQLSERGK